MQSVKIKLLSKCSGAKIQYLPSKSSQSLSRGPQGPQGPQLLLVPPGSSWLRLKSGMVLRRLRTHFIWVRLPTSVLCFCFSKTSIFYFLFSVDTMFGQTIKNFVINLNAPNGRSTISSGDLVEGHISFDLTKETKITSITVELRGRAHVHWSSGGGKNKRNISSKVDFFKLKSVVLQDNGSMRPPRLLHARKTKHQSVLVGSDSRGVCVPPQLPEGQQNCSLARMCIRSHVSSPTGVYERSPCKLGGVSQAGVTWCGWDGMLLFSKEKPLQMIMLSTGSSLNFKATLKTELIGGGPLYQIKF